MNKPNYNIDHVLKQKEKRLEDGYVYSVVNGKTEMHKLDDILINGHPLGMVLARYESEIAKLKEVNKKQKTAIITNKKRIDTLEELIKKYGIQ